MPRKKVGTAEGEGKPEPVGRGRGTRGRSPAACRRLLRKTLAEEYEEILRAFVKAAKSGSASHMKLATDLLEKGRSGPRGEGSAAALVRELEERGEL